jgi:hypothetical protein
MTFGRNPYENEPSQRFYDDAYTKWEEYVEECKNCNEQHLDFDEWLQRYMDDRNYD